MAETMGTVLGEGATKVSASGPWVMPEWMYPYLDCFTNTGRPVHGPETIEEMYNKQTNAVINFPLSTLEACVIAQVHMLGRLHVEGLLGSPGRHSEVVDKAVTLLEEFSGELWRRGEEERSTRMGAVIAGLNGSK
jgi:hypothetical protein